MYQQGYRPQQQQQARTGRSCPKCRSTDVSIQAVSITKNKHHGLIYWLFFGWLIDIFLWIFAFIPRLFISIFRGRKVKTKVHSECVCQNCGYRWRA